MTLEEIKGTYTMKDILSRYGIQPNRAGFCRCPFHNERTASFRVYKDSYYCFGCGCSGDVISFVQQMDGRTFKEAFISLGGTYEHKSKFSTRAAIYKAQKAREQRQKAEIRAKNEKRLNLSLIDIYRAYLAKSAPLSDVWCDCYNALQYQLYVHADLNGLQF